MVPKVFIVKNGCPLCGGDVVGNDDVKYYCKRCNLLFNKSELRIQRQGKQKNAAGEEQAKTRSYKTLFVASKLSDKFHRKDCLFAKNINKENLISFNSASEALKKGFKPCKNCLRDLKK